MPFSGKPKALFFALLLFPFLLGFLGNWLLFQETGDQRRRATEIRLEAAISRIESEKDPDEYYSRLFRRIERRVFAGPHPRKNWEAVSRRLKRKYGKKIETIFLDGTGNPVSGFCDRPVPKTLTQRFFRGYGKFLREKKPLDSIEQSFVKSFLGNYIPCDFEIHSRLLFSEADPGKQYVYFSKPDPAGMFFLFFRPGNDLREMAALEQISLVNRSQAEFRLTLARSGEKAGTVLKRLEARAGTDVRFWTLLEKNRVGRAWINDDLFVRRILFPSIWLVGKSSLPSTPGFFLGAQSDLTAGKLHLGVLFLLGLWVFFPAKGVPISVRGKLLFSFIYASVIPLVLMGLTARSFLGDRELVLIQETHQEMESALLGFDRNFKNHLEDLEEQIQSHYYSFESPPENGFRDFSEKFEKYRSHYHFDSCRIFDRKGIKVFESTNKNFPTIFGGQVKLLGKIAQQVISQNDAALAGEASFRGGGEASASPPLQKGDPMLAGFPLKPHFFNEVRMGTIDLFVGSIPLGNPDNSISHIAYCLWNRNKLEWDYVTNTIPGLARKAGKGEFFAWAPDIPEQVFPREFRHRKLLFPSIPKVTNRKKSFRSSIQDSGRTYFVTGVKGTILQGISLLGLTSDIQIRGEIDGLKWRFQFISLVILGTCFIIGFLLSRLFLDPIANLTQGLEAVSKRNFAFQIPVTSHDELGRLGNLFNETITELKDLELARTIQESLFPSGKMTWGRWELYGSCRPASRVGGDYFDFFPLDENRAVLLIGDVSGHGVGAALVVAMAKGVIHHPGTLKDPTRMLALLNQVLFFILNRKKMMSCCLGILNKTDNSLVLAHAGHTFPLRLREGKADFLEMKGYPLGSVKNWKSSSLTVSLQPGDALAFYTDGLIEAVDRSKAPIGYDRFSQTLPGLLGGDVKKTEENIRTWHQNLAPKDPPEDDISLIIVQEAPAEEKRS